MIRVTWKRVLRIFEELSGALGNWREFWSEGRAEDKRGDLLSAQDRQLYIVSRISGETEFILCRFELIELSF